MLAVGISFGDTDALKKKLIKEILLLCFLGAFQQLICIIFLPFGKIQEIDSVQAAESMCSFDSRETKISL